MMHKFLATGARGPLSGFAWPAPALNAPGAWVEVEGPLSPFARLAFRPDGAARTDDV